MSIERQKTPIGKMDARVWADEFTRIVRLHPQIAKDKEAMTTWFAEAIMTGYDHHANKM